MARLADHGIHLKRPRIGWQGAPCPSCACVKRRPHDDALGVELFADGGARWSCRRCGWKGVLAGDGRAQERRRAPPPTPATVRPTAGLPDAAAGLWAACQPVRRGTVAGAYLDRRGCALPHRDGDLRWHPALRHRSGHVGPGLVALVTDAATGEAMTIHRTWIEVDGSGKAAIECPRLLWPGLPKAGGVVRLVVDDAVTIGLCVAEGIETALSAICGGYPCWATVDAGNLAVLPVLGGIEALTIIADHDEVNPKTGERPGLAAAEACASRWVEAGREVRLWHAPTEGTDFNDFARGAAA